MNKKLIVTSGFILFFFMNKAVSQDMSDCIYTKEGDSIVCKITQIQKNWIYYDHQKKKKIKNSYIHIDDIRIYINDGIKTVPNEYKLWGRIDSIGSRPDNIHIDSNERILDTSANPKDWHIGYLLFKNSKDTLFGWVKQDRWKGSRYGKIVFKKTLNVPFETFLLDSLKGYKWGNLTFRYFNYSGYSELLKSGEISIYKGWLQYTQYPEQCLVLTKNDHNPLFISVEATKGVHSSFYQGGILKQKAKQKIEEYISDSPQLLIELQKDTFRYEDIEELIVKYNDLQRIKK